MENIELTADDVEPLNETRSWVALNVKISKGLKMGASYILQHEK